MKIYLSLIATFFLVVPAFAQDPIADPEWRFTLDQPADGWTDPAFDDSKWSTGAGGFGNPSTPASRVGTEWLTKNIWMRRNVELKSIPLKPALYIHHDEDVEVYINGQKIAALAGFSTRYEVVPIDAKSAQAIRQGGNAVAVHCSQTGGGQFIDVHIIDSDSIPKLQRPKRSTVPTKSNLITKWGKEVTADNAWREYPRPELQRTQWQNLNGNWNYAITPRLQREAPETWQGKILVPFSLESKLSGVQRLLEPEEDLWYQVSFETKPNAGQSTLLHFEAVDYRCRVSVNGSQVGEHVGGNTPFTFDITQALKSGTNSLVVQVSDETEGSQLRGKQAIRPEGIWYTQVSGIWQTVWIEHVSPLHIEDLKITTDAKSGTIQVKTILAGKGTGKERVEVKVSDDSTVAVANGAVDTLASVTIPNAKRWSPSTPHLYDINVRLLDGDKVIDSVKSYAGIRTVGKQKDSEGNWRFTLNDKPIFHWGPLDQGWWPDGLLTPPSEAAMLSDIEFLKDAGFNMIRKHIKVEPRRYYYDCDRLGMLVWQDQVSGGVFAPWTFLEPNPRDAIWTDADHEQYMLELQRMITELENHPSIVIWTPFNEAWSQHRTTEVGSWLSKRDGTRLVNIASGGNFWPSGDIVDFHSYPHPSFPFDSNRDRDYVKVVGEFGGHGYAVPGHIWRQSEANWGYGGLPKNLAEYRDRYVESIRILAELKKKGISGGVYTQTTDVEGEINGLLTYDREVAKITKEELRKIHQILEVNISK